MTLQDKLREQHREDQANAKARAAEQRAATRQKVLDMVAKVFGEPTGEMQRGNYGRDEPVYRIPDTMVVEPGPSANRATVDGILFQLTYGTNAAPELKPVLVCPDCGEEFLGSQVYRTSHTGVTDISTLAVEVETQRPKYGAHACYAGGVTAVLNAARRHASRSKGITTRELLARAAAELRWDER
jgi:hypothetical protein